MLKKIYIEDLGCSRRGLDASKFARYFTNNGYQITKNPKKADVLFLITCAYESITEEVSVKRIVALKKLDGRLIVGGCLNAINKKRLEEVFDGETVDTAENEEIDKLFPSFEHKYRSFEDENKIFWRNISQLAREYAFLLKTIDLTFLKRFQIYLKRKGIGKDYWYIRIGSGCISEHCSFCQIWKAIGPLKSKPRETCIGELKKALELGYKKIVLTSDNSGAYGLDVGMTFPDLLESLLSVPGEYTIDIECLHPYWLIRYIDRMQPFIQDRRINMMQIPLQSGSDRILKLMNRRHSTADLTDALKKVRNLNGKTSLYTHVIAGFPTETDAEFRESLRAVKEGGFNLVTFFHFDSPIALLNNETLRKGMIADEVIKKRIKSGIKFCKRNSIIGAKF